MFNLRYFKYILTDIIGPNPLCVQLNFLSCAYMGLKCFRTIHLGLYNHVKQTWDDAQLSR